MEKIAHAIYFANNLQNIMHVAFYRKTPEKVQRPKILATTECFGNQLIASHMS